MLGKLIFPEYFENFAAILMRKKLGIKFIPMNHCQNVLLQY